MIVTKTNPTLIAIMLCNTQAIRTHAVFVEERGKQGTHVCVVFALVEAPILSAVYHPLMFEAVIFTINATMTATILLCNGRILTTQ